MPSASAGTAGRGLTARPWWPAAKRIATAAFFAAVAWLLVTQARELDWPEVWASIRGQPPLHLALAALFAGASHALYPTYDLIGRWLTRHPLPPRQVICVAHVSYAYNLNFGSLVGGIAFRYRLYSRLGLPNATITTVLGASLVTNWLGYLALGGSLFLWRPPALPATWPVGPAALQAIGGAMLAAAAAYGIACAFARQRTLSWRGHALHLAPLRLALLQLLLSSANWMLIAGAVSMLMPQRIDYPTVLAVMLLAAMAGVIAHVPAGLGVLEAVFVALLGSRVPPHELIGALLAYRALYYLVPLATATLLLARLEARAGRAAARERGLPTRRHPPSPSSEPHA